MPYDLDVEARAQTERLGLHLERAESPNDDPAFIAVFGDGVLAAAAGAPEPG